MTHWRQDLTHIGSLETESSMMERISAFKKRRNYLKTWRSFYITSGIYCNECAPDSYHPKYLDSQFLRSGVYPFYSCLLPIRKLHNNSNIRTEFRPIYAPLRFL